MYCRNLPNRFPVNPNMPQRLITLLIEAMKDERSDRSKYKTMMDMTKNPKVKRQLNFAYEDEGRHYILFQKIYRDLTNKPIDIPMPPPKNIVSLREAIESSIDDELAAVELYRKIMFMLPHQDMKNTLFEIITDEQEHAIRLTYLVALDNKREIEE